MLTNNSHNYSYLISNLFYFSIVFPNTYFSYCSRLVWKERWSLMNFWVFNRQAFLLTIHYIPEYRHLTLPLPDHTVFIQVKITKMNIESLESWNCYRIFFRLLFKDKIAFRPPLLQSKATTAVSAKTAWTGINTVPLAYRNVCLTESS